MIMTFIEYIINKRSVLQLLEKQKMTGWNDCN